MKDVPFKASLILLAVLFVCFFSGFAKDKPEADSIQIRLSLNTTLFKFRNAGKIQAYSPGLHITYRRHTLSGNWDLLDDYFFDFDNRLPQGFQIGYRYGFGYIFSRISFYGELNYRHFSYLFPEFEHIRYAQNAVSGIADYVYMGNVAARSEITILPFLAASVSVGYGFSYVEQFVITTNQTLSGSSTQWLVSFEVNVLIGNIRF
ncbi:MAG: hypothetical protein R3C61_23375 [Bacteroidia bacterium]